MAVVLRSAEKGAELMAGAALKMLDDPTVRALLSAVDSPELRKKVIDEALRLVKDSLNKQIKGAAVVFAAEALLKEGNDND